MIEKEYFHIQLEKNDEVYGNYEDLAGDNFYIKQTEGVFSFFDFDTRSIIWFKHIHEVQNSFPCIDLHNPKLLSDQTENFVFTLLYVLGVENKSFSMN
jgi:hypothetical protein